MKSRWFLILCVFAVAVVSAIAQTKTVSNFELEKYKQKRVQAERDLNENYKRLGFSSPEERERRLETWKQESKELSDRLERARLEQENADALAQQAAALAAQQRYYQSTQPDYPVYDNGLIYSYGYGYRNRFRPFRLQQPSGYFAGGAFWPSPSPARQPIFIRRTPVRPRH
jgi:hypothetical protein